MKISETIYYSILTIVIGGSVFGMFNTFRGCEQDRRSELNKCIEKTQKPLECMQSFPR